MALNAGILDPSIISQGVRESKIDLATPVNMYTSLRADSRAQKLSELTLSKEEKAAKREADLQGIIKSSLTPEGHINSEKAIVDLNRAGFIDEASHIQDRYTKAAEARKTALDAQDKEMSTAFLTAADSKNPVEAFLLAREEGTKNGWKMSPGLTGYNPSDEEIASGKFTNPKVMQELIYHGEKTLTPEQRIARAKQAGGGAEGEEYGLAPIYGTRDGKPVALQTSKRGGVKEITLPEGITLTPGVTHIDMGDATGILDKSGKVVAKITKGIDPGKKADLGLKGEELKLKQAEDARQAADAEAKKIETAKKARAYDQKNKGAIESLQTFLDKAHSVKESPYLSAVSGAGRYNPKTGSKVPVYETKGKDLQADIDFLVSSGIIETLANLKSQSPTGASGFGAMSEKEMGVIQNAFSILGNEDISANKKKEELSRIITILEKRQREYRAFSKESNDLLGPEPTEQETLDSGIDGL